MTSLLGQRDIIVTKYMANIELMVAMKLESEGSIWCTFCLVVQIQIQKRSVQNSATSKDICRSNGRQVGLNNNQTTNRMVDSTKILVLEASISSRRVSEDS